MKSKIIVLTIYLYTGFFTLALFANGQSMAVGGVSPYYYTITQASDYFTMTLEEAMAQNSSESYHFVGTSTDIISDFMNTAKVSAKYGPFKCSDTFSASLKHAETSRSISIAYTYDTTKHSLLKYTLNQKNFTNVFKPEIDKANKIDKATEVDRKQWIDLLAGKTGLYFPQAIAYGTQVTVYIRLTFNNESEKKVFKNTFNASYGGSFSVSASDSLTDSHSQNRTSFSITIDINSINTTESFDAGLMASIPTENIANIGDFDRYMGDVRKSLAGYINRASKDNFTDTGTYVGVQRVIVQLYQLRADDNFSKNINQFLDKTDNCLINYANAIDKANSNRYFRTYKILEDVLDSIYSTTVVTNDFGQFISFKSYGQQATGLKPLVRYLSNAVAPISTKYNELNENYMAFFTDIQTTSAASDLVKYSGLINKLSDDLKNGVSIVESRNHDNLNNMLGSLVINNANSKSYFPCNSFFNGVVKYFVIGSPPWTQTDSSSLVINLYNPTTDGWENKWFSKTPHSTGNIIWGDMIKRVPDVNASSPNSIMLMQLIYSNGKTTESAYFFLISQYCPTSTNGRLSTVTNVINPILWSVGNQGSGEYLFNDFDETQYSSNSPIINLMENLKVQPNAPGVNIRGIFGCPFMYLTGELNLTPGYNI